VDDFYIESLLGEQSRLKSVSRGTNVARMPATITDPQFHDDSLKIDALE
jgi:hypothetical protein